MAISGELPTPDQVESLERDCAGCRKALPAKVLQSAAGFYIGTFCPECGPNDRWTGYYQSKRVANDSLESGDFVERLR